MGEAPVAQFGQSVGFRFQKLGVRVPSGVHKVFKINNLIRYEKKEF